MTDAKRESWMSAQFEKELTAAAENGTVSCARIQEFAVKHNLAIIKMKSFVDCIGLKVTGCQKLCA